MMVKAAPRLATILCLRAGHELFRQGTMFGKDFTVGSAAERGRVSRHTSMPSRMLSIPLLTFAMPMGITASDDGAISFAWQGNQAGKTEPSLMDQGNSFSNAVSKRSKGLSRWWRR
jgi:hypothetical protein